MEVISFMMEVVVLVKIVLLDVVNAVLLINVLSVIVVIF